MRRLRELDALRGMAALTILVHHNLLAAGLLTSAAAAALLGTPASSLVKGRHAVMFFFVLSGFVLARQLGRLTTPMTAPLWGLWAAQRTIRLGVPVLASTLLSAALYHFFYSGSWPDETDWLRSYLWQTPPSPATLAEQSLLLSSTFRYGLNNVLWSLAHEWRISLLLPVVVALKPLRGREGALWICIAGLALAGLAGGRWGESLSLNPGVLGQLRSTAYFILPFAVGVALERVAPRLAGGGDGGLG